MILPTGVLAHSEILGNVHGMLQSFHYCLFTPSSLFQEIIQYYACDSGHKCDSLGHYGSCIYDICVHARVLLLEQVEPQWPLLVERNIQNLQHNCSDNRGSVRYDIVSLAHAYTMAGGTKAKTESSSYVCFWCRVCVCESYSFPWLEL
jgi:hypothetical protein